MPANVLAFLAGFAVSAGGSILGSALGFYLWQRAQKRIHHNDK